MAPINMYVPHTKGHSPVSQLCDHPSVTIRPTQLSDIPDNGFLMLRSTNRQTTADGY